MSRTTTALIACIGLVLTACTTSTPPPPGESLSGWAGKVRRALPLSNTVAKGDCPSAARAYINASGHSAYASTDITAAAYQGLGGVCGVALNKKSVEEAEALAIRHCQAGTQKWSRSFAGKCEIHASK
ncbi:hypothetical protein [Hoeflea poritis]|uniref:DUF4189 domain-containing protein n=1 Tax=Hoeflea poritis TaxID=2993659 RepID=A0ABT4VJ27_9HYPH|nr:hypothetical protein [Hoeflea poritis]MDA4844707.1 hypothetical protein [Hoeflea poritis]